MSPNEPPLPPAPENPTEKPRRRPGRFSKGASGNPKGRPRGSRNQATLLQEALLEDHAEPVLRKLIEQAEAGEPHAQKLYLERIFPARKDRPVHLPLGPVQTLADLTAALSTVTQATGEGRITPQEGETVTAMLTAQIPVFAVQELRERVARVVEEIALLKQERVVSGPPIIDIASELVAGRTLPEASGDPA